VHPHNRLAPTTLASRLAIGKILYHNRTTEDRTSWKPWVDKSMYTSSTSQRKILSRTKPRSKKKTIKVASGTILDVTMQEPKNQKQIWTWRKLVEPDRVLVPGFVFGRGHKNLRLRINLHFTWIRLGTWLPFDASPGNLIQSSWPI
jgi:hypothetical protein